VRGNQRGRAAARDQISVPSSRAWAVRTLVWATALTLPCWLISRSYAAWLSVIVKSIVDLAGYSLRIHQLEISAPYDLGMYASLCLASRNAPSRFRTRAITFGLPLLVALQIGLLVVSTFIILAGQNGSLSGTLYREFPRNLLKSIGWVNALLLWLMWLGVWELPWSLAQTPISKKRGR
jgi:hypothetical protein